MKKYYLLFSVIVLSLIISIPVFVRAETEEGDDSNSSSTLKSVLPSIRNNYLRPKVENIENNESLRNRLGLSSTTRTEIKDLKEEDREDSRDIREQGRTDLKNASSSWTSSTTMRERQEDRREIKKDMRKDLFEQHKKTLVSQLNLALNNLRQIRERITARITKAESSGRNMTNAKALLVTADSKITLAQQAIDALISLVPPTASTTIATSTASSTINIDLTKPREIGDSAIKAIKNAHKALVDVVTAIAHSMGLKLGNDNASTTPATTTPQITATTTTATTATTTP